MRETIRATLAADATLTATLTGGVHAATEISRQLATAAFDSGGEIQPCALVKVEQEAQHGPYRVDALSARTYVVVYVYQRAGYDSIDTALARIRALLHGQKLASGTWRIDWAGESGDLEDQGLACAMRYARYVVTRLIA